MVRGLGINPQTLQKLAPPRWGYLQSCYILLNILHLPSAQPIQTVSSVRDLGLLLHAGFSADDNVAHASKKTVECFFT